MDMKKILQALDSTASKPVEGTSDMKRFVSIIQESNSTQVLNEGANPHKVTLPVQMAMQHYQKPVEKKKSRPALIDKYFHQVQEEQLQEKQERRKLINQYAQTIAERVLMKESKGDYVPPKEADYGDDYQDMVKRVADQEKRKREKQQPKKEEYNPNVSPNAGFEPGPGGPGLMPNEGQDNQPDVVALDIPLLIRIMEFAREDAKTDMDLHNLAERLIAMSAEGATLTMDDYDALMGNVQEAKKIKAKKKSDPCWSNYHQIGMKKKNGKMVPNCVAKNSSTGNDK